jgi:hypothetical protein
MITRIYSKERDIQRESSRGWRRDKKEGKLGREKMKEMDKKR